MTRSSGSLRRGCFTSTTRHDLLAILVKVIVLLIVEKTFLIDDVNVVLHAFVLWQDLRWVPECLDRQVLLVLRMVVTAEIQSLLALELLFWDAIGAGTELVVQRTEELLNEGVRELTVKVVGALLPAAVVLDVGATLQIVEVKVWWSPEVLLAMGVVALRPFVLLVDVRTKACLV